MIQGEEIVGRSTVESLATGVDHWRGLKLGRHHRGWATRGELSQCVIVNENTFLRLDRVLMLLEALRRIWRALELTRENPKSRIETAVRFVPSRVPSTHRVSLRPMSPETLSANLSVITITREEVSRCDHAF